MEKLCGLIALLTPLLFATMTHAPNGATVVAAAGDDHIIFEATRSAMGFTRPRGTTEIWISDDKVYIGGTRQIDILRYDLNRRWLILPNRKFYYEHPLDKPAIDEAPAKNSLRKIGFDYEPNYDWIIKDAGEEQVMEGRHCRRYIADGDADYSAEIVDLRITQDVPIDLQRYYEKYVKSRFADEPQTAGLYKAFPALARSFVFYSKTAISPATAPEFVDEIKVTKVESAPSPPGIYELPEDCQKTNSYDEFVQASRRR